MINKPWKHWHWNRLWFEWGIKRRDWGWSIHSWPCCFLFVEAGPVAFGVDRYSLDDVDWPGVFDA